MGLSPMPSNPAVSCGRTSSTSTGVWRATLTGVRCSDINPMANICCPGSSAVSLLKHWLLGTHQGAVGHDHLDYYLDEFHFRFNRRKSASRGKLFYRLAQQAVQVEPAPFASLVHHKPKGHG